MSTFAGGDHTIEDFIYLTDPYRTTSIRPRYPLPMVLHRVPQNILCLFKEDSPLPALRTEIEKLLKQHKVNFYSVRFRTLSKPGYCDNTDNKYITLLIYAKIEDSGNQWSQARRAIRSLLRDNEIDVHVEILDPVRSYQPSLFPILPSDIYIKVYESFRERMVADIEVALRGVWTSMCLYKIGNSLETSEYAVVVMVRPLSVRDWQALKGQLYNKHIRGAASPTDRISIHFMPGKVFVGEGKTPGKDLRRGLPKSFPNTGSSIGIDGKLGIGTLGAFMSLHVGEIRDKTGTIKEPARNIRGFVTNSHFTAPSDKSHPTIIENYHKNGVDWNADALGPSRSALKYPAKADLVATMEAISMGVDQCTRGMSEYEHRIEEAEMYGDEYAITRNQIGRQNWAERLTYFQERKTLCDRLPLTLGRTYWASGRALHDKNGSIDFAFVEIDGRKAELWDHCSSHNVLPKETGPRFASYLQQDYKKKLDDMEDVPYPHPERMSEAFGDMIKGKWYFKTGRTTGVTTGICHGTEVFCRIPASEQRKRIYNADGSCSECTDHGYTTELIVMKSSFISDKETKQGNMALTGDSGAIYLDHLGCPAGLGFERLTGLCGPTGDERKGWLDTSDGAEVDEREEGLGTFDHTNIALVTCISEIQRHLRLRINGQLGFC